MSLLKGIEGSSCAICGHQIGDRKNHSRKKLMKCLWASNRSLVKTLQDLDIAKGGENANKPE